MNWNTYSIDIIAATLAVFLAKIWSIASGYILTHYIIDGLIHHGIKWLHRHPVEYAIIKHTKDRHKKLNPVHKNPRICDQGYCVIVPK